MADSSFDVVSKVERQEVDNALNQASKEVGQRFDFKGTGASIVWSGDDGVVITANSDERAMSCGQPLNGIPLTARSRLRLSLRCRQRCGIRQVARVAKGNGL